MKKYIILLLLTITLILGGCSNSKETTETTDAPDFFDIQLNCKAYTIELISPEGKTVVLADEDPSKPVKSPNGKKAAYISPWGWETLSVLYIVDLKDGSKKALVSHDFQNQPKEVIWEDDEHVLVIIGYPYGTIAIGGNIYRVNVISKDKEALTHYDSYTQITDLHLIEGVLYYNGIQYTDKEYIHYKDYSNQITLTE